MENRTRFSVSGKPQVRIIVHERGSAVIDFVYYGFVLEETEHSITILSGWTQVTFPKSSVTIEDWS